MTIADRSNPPGPARSRTGLVIGVIAAGLAGLCVAGVAVLLLVSYLMSPTRTASAAPTVSIAAAPAAPEPTRPQATAAPSRSGGQTRKPVPWPTDRLGNPAPVAGDGFYRVGTDVAPGLWASRGDAAGQRCHWLVDHGSSEAQDIGAGRQQVLVRQGDFFQTTGCKTWNWLGSS